VFLRKRRYTSGWTSIYDTLFEARSATDANASLVMVPARVVRDALFEVIDVEMRLPYV